MLMPGIRQVESRLRIKVVPQRALFHVPGDEH
jgi:hypothetical protein